MNFVVLVHFSTFDIFPVKKSGDKWAFEAFARPPEGSEPTSRHIIGVRVPTAG